MATVEGFIYLQNITMHCKSLSFHTFWKLKAPKTLTTFDKSGRGRKGDGQTLQNANGPLVLCVVGTDIALPQGPHLLQATRENKSRSKSALTTYLCVPPVPHTVWVRSIVALSGGGGVRPRSKWLSKASCLFVQAPGRAGHGLGMSTGDPVLRAPN